MTEEHKNKTPEYLLRAAKTYTYKQANERGKVRLQKWVSPEEKEKLLKLLGELRGTKNKVN